MMILHNSSARINKVLKSLSASALSDVSSRLNVPVSVWAPMLLLYSPGSAGRCPHRLMSVEMVVRRRRRDTPDCDQIPLLLLPSLLTPALQRILPATGPRPTPGTGHITESLTHPGPLSLSWQQNIRKVLQLLRTEERFSAARIFPVLTVLTS